MYTINNFLPLIRNGSKKKIIYITTGLADLDATLTAGLPASLGYASSKAAMNIIMAKYAVELGQEGILVLSLSPGWVETDAGMLKPSFVASLLHLARLR